MPFRNRQLFSDVASGASNARVKRNAVPMADRLLATKEVWRAFNDWLGQRFVRRRGVCVGSFARITWERTADAEGTRYRPFFLPTEQFCRSARLQIKRNLQPLDLAECEEVNFSRIAIKHSRRLTKDQVFNGLRDLFAHIAKAVGSGQQVEIQFKVGTMTCRDGQLRFDFDPEFLIEANQRASSRREEQDGQTEAGGAGEEEAEAEAEAEAPRSLWSKQQQQRSQTAPAVHVPSLSLETLTQSGLTKATALEARVGQALAPPSEPEEAPEEEEEERPEEHSTDGGDEGEAGEEHEVDEATADAAATGDHPVIVAAYERYFKAMEDTVKQDEAEMRILRMRADAIEAEQQRKAARAKQSELVLQDEIVNQIQFHEAVKKQERERQLAMATTVEYPPLDPVGKMSSLFGESTKFGHAMSPDAVAQVAKQELMRNYDNEREAKRSLLANLQRQMQDKKDREDAAKRFQLEEERRYLDHVAEEMARIKTLKEVERQAKQHKLMIAWQRDQKYKNILAERQRAVHLGRGLPPAPAPGSPAGSTASSSSQSVFARQNLSVGYDVRTGRRASSASLPSL